MMTDAEKAYDDLLRESCVLSAAVAALDLYYPPPPAAQWASARNRAVIAALRALDAGHPEPPSLPPTLAELHLEAIALDAAARWYDRHGAAPGNKVWRAGRAEYVAGEIRRLSGESAADAAGGE